MRRTPSTESAASLAACACVGAGGADGGSGLGVGGTSQAAAGGAASETAALRSVSGSGGGVAQGGAASEAASSGVNSNHLPAKPPLVRAASQNVTYSSLVSSAFRSAGVEIDDTKNSVGTGVVKFDVQDSSIWR